jgi:lipoyl(octanoyl) transferase
VVQTLCLLPWHVATAAENMALDWLLLENFPEPDSVRLRCYGWAQPAWTFGYGQKWAEAQAASGQASELIRRPTGGGLVDHRHDWTYALVIPASHLLAQARACESYRVVHEALSAALIEAGVPNHLEATCPSLAKNKFSICFQRPERFDLVRTDTGQKIAGAAQKRTRKGMLLQGTVDRRLSREVSNWIKLGPRFFKNIASKLDVASIESQPLPSPEALVKETTERFSSEEWNRKK